MSSTNYSRTREEDLARSAWDRFVRNLEDGKPISFPIPELQAADRACMLASFWARADHAISKHH